MVADEHEFKATEGAFGEKRAERERMDRESPLRLIHGAFHP